MKRGLVCFGLVLMCMFFVVAEDNFSLDLENDSFDDGLYEGYEDEKLRRGAGSTQGDTFYFIDKFFDRFADDLSVKEERIAEIKQLIEEGDIENAKIVLKDYMELADKLEHEIDPERREEAKRSAAAIRNAMKDIRDELPEGERGRFVSDVMNREHSIATAAEIAGKIKELCIQLAELDPVEYSKMCRTDNDAPQWKKKLDKELSAEQEETAREFVKIMSECFKTSGQDCKCEDIPFYDFSIACSKAAPLAVACDIDGDEDACDDLDDLKMPELPDWLQPIWEDLEDDMNDAQYDMHMPRECVEVGATTRKACSVVMVKNNAPLECRSALIKAAEEGEVDRRVFEKICDEIMMREHAPECAEKGITDPEECKDFMDSFRGDDRKDRPSQCNAAEMTNEGCAEWIIETLGIPEPCAGLDGEQCKKVLVGAWGGPGNYEGPTGFGPDCGRIEDSMERLECYDNKGSEFEDRYGPRDGEMPEGEITWQCKENRIHWGPDCEIFMSDEWPEQERRRVEEGEKKRMEEQDWRAMEEECRSRCDLEREWWDYRNGECICYATGGIGPESGEDSTPRCGDCGSECESRSGEILIRTDCGDNGCECYYESEEEYNLRTSPSQEESECHDCSSQCAEGEHTDCVDNTCVCLGYGESGPPSSGEDSGSTDSGSSDVVEVVSVTGEVISNKFLDYYSR